MTQDELDALPVCGEIEMVREVRNGMNVEIPVMRGFALWQEEGDPTSVTDSHGRCWMVGWHDGVRYKRALPA